jgi:preprotein translocase subunit Sec61beta
MPAASAGLLRFFEEETPGIKVRPEVVIMMSIGLIAVSLFIFLALKPG